jgi:hypothetical protein
MILHYLDWVFLKSFKQDSSLVLWLNGFCALNQYFMLSYVLQKYKPNEVFNFEVEQA